MMGLKAKFRLSDKPSEAERKKSLQNEDMQGQEYRNEWSHSRAEG